MSVGGSGCARVCRELREWRGEGRREGGPGSVARTLPKSPERLNQPIPLQPPRLIPATTGTALLCRCPRAPPVAQTARRPPSLPPRIPPPLLTDTLPLPLTPADRVRAPLTPYAYTPPFPLSPPVPQHNARLRRTRSPQAREWRPSARAAAGGPAAACEGSLPVSRGQRRLRLSSPCFGGGESACV